MGRFHSPSVSPSSADEGERETMPPSPMDNAYSSEQPFEGYNRVRPTPNLFGSNSCER